jgi:hypothetical protein
VKNFTELHRQFLSELNDINPTLSPLMRSWIATLMVMERQKGREEQYHEDLTAMRRYVLDVGDRLGFRAETDPWEYRNA